MSVLTIRTGRNPFVGVAGAVSRFADAFVAALAASREYERMQALTDRQLAAEGIARDDLARTVYERHFR